MIRHIVMWKLRPNSPAQRQADIERLREGFLGLRGRIPGLLRLEIGLDTSLVDYACDVVLYSEFESQEALQAYASHPAHLAVRDALVGIRIDRHQVDYEPMETAAP